MKRIVNNERYDTETATHVHCWTNGFSSGDFGYVEQNLYITKNGTWFIHGQGGPQSNYATHRGSSVYGGEQITPYTADEALEWLQDHNAVDAIEEHFGDQIEDA